MATITNLFRNPSFEVNATYGNWSSGGGGDRANDTTYFSEGAKSLKYYASGSGRGVFLGSWYDGSAWEYHVPLVQGQEVGVAFDIRHHPGNSGDWNIVAAELSAAGGVVTTATLETLDPSDAAFERKTYTYTATGASTAYIQINVTRGTASAANIYFDRVLMVNMTTDGLDAVPDWFDGDSTDAAWNGTADLSASTLTYTPNTAPTVDAGADTTITAGDTLTRTVSFVDPDADTWSATADYGEGAGAVAATVDQGAKTVALSNLYETAGVYTVTVVVNDGTDTGQDTFIVTVNEVGGVIIPNNAYRAAILHAGGWI